MKVKDHMKGKPMLRDPEDHLIQDFEHFKARSHQPNLFKQRLYPTND